MQKFQSIVISIIMILNIFTIPSNNLGNLMENDDKYIGSHCLATDSDAVYCTSIENDLEITAKSAILIEAGSGKILYSKNETEELKPASVTKIMTVLLCYDEIKAGNMAYEDVITISEHAASMGGSQCFFEEGETQSVYDIIKCIQISSGNDAAVAMGEHIAGTEEEFVKMMNARAKELGMTHTNFENACGLDSSNHYTCALDIGIMSRELITKHPEIFDISTIWMDHIIHKTNKGESRFDLANTNKFLKQYTGANGLKTGYTSEAGYCMSGTATRDGITLIAVVMGADTKEIRNNEVARLLDFGFSKSQQYVDSNVIDEEVKVKVSGGIKNFVSVEPIIEHKISLFDVNPNNVEKKIEINKNINAPIRKGDNLGNVIYYYNDEVLSKVPMVSSEDVAKKSFSFTLGDLCNRFFVIE